MLRRRHKRALAIIALTLSACRSPAPELAPPLQTVTLRLQATESTVQLLRDLTNEYQIARPDVRILAHINTLTHDDALSVTREEEAVYALVDYLPSDAPHWAAPVARDQIAILTGPNTGVNALSLSELQAVLTGRITNWAALDGTDLPITVVSREDSSGSQQAIQDMVLGSRPIVQTARLATSQAAMLRILSETPGAIGYNPNNTPVPANLTTLVLDGHTPDPVPNATYPLATTLYVIGPAEPQGILRDFLAWVQSNEGQTVVARHYIPAFLE